MDFNLDDIWGTGPEHGRSPTSANRPPSTPIGEANASPRAEPPPQCNEPKPLPQRDDPNRNEAQPSNGRKKTPHGSHSQAAKGVFKSLIEYLYFFLSWASYSISFAFYCPLIMKPLSMLFGLWLSWKLACGFGSEMLDGITSKFGLDWGFFGHNPHDLHSLTFNRPISHVETTHLHRILVSTYEHLEEEDSEVAFEMKSPFHQASKAAEAFNELNGYFFDNMEAESTRHYQQLEIVLKELNTILDSDEPPEQPWYKVFLPLNEWGDVIQLRNRLRTIVQEAQRVREDELVKLNKVASTAETSLSQQSLCSPNSYMIKMDDKSWSVRDINAAKKFICASEKWINDRLENVGSIVRAFRETLELYETWIDEAQTNSDSREAFAKHLRRYAVDIMTLYEEFALLKHTESQKN